jgi:fibrillarin-like rRNA methylase
MRHETPAATGTRRVLYLGASDGHCWSVTTDPAQAAGFYLVDKAAA